ncbi:translation elongation factor Ts [Youngiibacter multivorans]|uniref:Elongation factor Ts n=1 Tax=Youngiibacter multivorans TaxID=937251 RepID=A0ABS4G210_9CLOT|nr:translation elongation factor Ts [Youngiibacter multivorans]MBP1918527.1 elongation factor Ts [Youngiibacter multivorans]
MISAQAVKELRDMTGAGMMDCKKALTEANGDMEKAVEVLRERGLAAAAKKSGRIAAEGVVATYVSEDKKSAAMVEFNCETDFVSANEAFTGLASDIAALVAKSEVSSIEDVKSLTLGEATVQDAVTALIAKLGENMSLRRYVKINAQDGVIASYIHMGGKIGVLVETASENATDEVANVARDVAMHVAALNPKYLDRTSVDEETIEKEKEIYRVQALNEGKPANIVEKMVLGRVQKFLKEVCLVEQQFVKNPDLTITGHLKEESKKFGSIAIKSFARFEKGEGIEKEEVDFAAEVAAQMKK